MRSLRNPRLQGKDVIYDITIIEGTMPQAARNAVLFIDILGFWRRNVRRVAIIGTTATVAAAGAATANAEASAAAAQAAAREAPGAAADGERSDHREGAGTGASAGVRAEALSSSRRY